MMSYNIDTTCWPHGLHMVVQGRMYSSQHGPSVELYKVDQFVEEFSIEFSCITQYKSCSFIPLLGFKIITTGLGRICNMEIRYQVSGMSEFRYGDPFRFVFSVFIFQPDHLVQEFACLSVINFRIYYPRHFIFRFPVNYDQSGGQLYSLRESVGCGRFKHGHMEDQMNRAHRFWKLESE